MQLKPIAAITVLLVVVVLVSISGCTSSNNAATATPTAAASTVPTAKPTVKPTAKPTVKPTAKPTVKPTAKPTSVPINAILVERPAGANGPDRTAEINKNMPTMPHHRVTIDGHDAYVYHGSATSSYVFPYSSYREAQALQASLVAKFQANGFTVSSSTQDVWGPNSILTDLQRGSTEVTISASDSATVSTLNILDTGSEVDILVS
jgi:hypothetical protein